MVSGALGSAVFSAVTVVLLTRRYPLVVEGVRCCEVAAHLHRRQASMRRQDGASLNCSSFYIVLDELLRTPLWRSSQGWLIPLIAASRCPKPYPASS